MAERGCSLESPVTGRQINVRVLAVSERKRDKEREERARVLGALVGSTSESLDLSSRREADLAPTISTLGAS